MYKPRLTILAALGFLALAAAPVRAEVIFAVNGNNELLSFDSAAPGIILTRTAISSGGDAILNIDFRPATGQLFGLSANNNLFTINVGTGLATSVGPTTITGGFDYGFDFNPVPDRIRVATDAGGNFRVNPANAGVTTDGNLFYVPGDANAGTAPQITGAAYTNNFPPSPRTPPPGTQLYYIDSNLDILGLSADPNSGGIQTVGSLGLDVTGLLGFDISGLLGTAYASLSGDALTSALYRINLSTGFATLIGNIGLRNGETILDISAARVPEAGGTAVLVAISTIGLLYFRRRISSNA